MDYVSLFYIYLTTRQIFPNRTCTLQASKAKDATSDFN